MNEAGLITLIADRVVSRIMEADPSRVIVGISNRHIHLCDADFRTLFGYEAPTVRKMVRQHGEFAAEETVTLHGPKGSMPRIRVMGPNRAQTQVELSQTDSLALGVKAPVAQSGQLASAAPIDIEGPAGRISLDHAVIIAGRHIHIGAGRRQSPRSCRPGFRQCPVRWTAGRHAQQLPGPGERLLHSRTPPRHR